MISSPQRMTQGLIWGVVVSLVCAVPNVKAEPKVRKLKPADTTGGTAAQLRVWKEVFATDRAVKVMVRPGKKSATELHLGLGLQLLEYQEVGTGLCTIEVYDEADGKTRLSTDSVSLESGDFTTLLLHESAGNISVEVIDDAVQSGSVTGELTVRSFAPALTSLVIKAGDELNVHLEGSSPFAHFRGLSRRVLQIDTAGVEATGKQVNWTNELDFVTHQRVTLVIVPDAYGRIRPRVIIDGAIR